MTVMQDDPLSLPGKYAQEQTPVVAVFNDSLTFSRQCLGGRGCAIEPCVGAHWVSHGGSADIQRG